MRAGPKHWPARIRAWAHKHIPPGLRFVTGLLLIAGGVVGFLPILGFWMIPLGIIIAGMDIVPLWRWLTGRGRNP